MNDFYDNTRGHLLRYRLKRAFVFIANIRGENFKNYIFLFKKKEYIEYPLSPPPGINVKEIVIERDYEIKINSSVLINFSAYLITLWRK